MGVYSEFYHSEIIRRDNAGGADRDETGER